ncbi:MAG: hypothetical protein RLZZ226_2158 [Pseudomonadota bacterium]
MKKSTLTTGLCVAVLLASPLAGAEPKYPAANFQPGVVYQDQDLIARHAARPAQIVPPGASSVSTDEKPSRSDAEGTVVKDEAFSSNAPILLAVLGLIGFALWFSKRSGAKASREAAPAQAAAVAPVAGATGETGVARYLKNIGVSASAVGAAVAETGVARYIKNLPTAAAKAVGAETGVARYLKNMSK